MRVLRVYGEAVKISAASSMAYRANFLFLVFMTFTGNMLLPLVTVLIYNTGASFPGWTFHEALLVQAAFMLCSGVCSPMFYNVVWITMSHIREGTYDLLLIKPGSVAFNTLAYSFEAESSGVLLGGLGLFAYSAANLPEAGAGWNWLLAAALFLMGICMSLGLVLIMASSAFVWVGNSRIFEIYDAFTALGRYPGTIYPKLVLNIVSYIIPVALLGSLPASAVLGRASPFALLSGVPCAAILAAGILLFNKMVSRYQSAGG